MARAYAQNSETIRSEHLVKQPTGIAEAILRGDPTRSYPRVRRIVRESGGAFATVSEAQIRQARRDVEDCEGLSPCFSASAAVAGLAQLALAGQIDPDAVILINLTGADRPDAPVSGDVHWIDRSTSGWMADSPETLTRLRYLMRSQASGNPRSL